MTYASITPSGVIVTGHVLREPGAPENLICAAVSALVQTARDALPAIAGTELTGSEESSGRIAFTFEDPSPGALVILEALALGLRNLAESFPGTIKVSSGL